MKGLVLIILGIALVSAGVFLIRRARAMPGTVDRQLADQPDTWYDFTDRVEMFILGFAMCVLGFVSGYRGFAEWFEH